MKHFGGKAPHRLTLYVEVLPTCVNKVNKAAVCKACIDKLEREVVLESSIFTNMKACTKVHLRKCPNFFKKYNEKERNEILYGSDNESQETNTVLSINSAASLSTTEYIVFEQHMLKSTISNGWVFRWTEDPEIVVLFKFLNPNLKLSSRHTLSGCILSLYSEELQHQHIIEAKKHKTGSILITSKGKVLAWGAKDISVKGGKTNDVIVTIKNFFIQAEMEAQMHAKINYKHSIEAAKSLEHNILANINTIFGSDRYKQTNSHDIEQESFDVIELETDENEEIVIEDNLESSINEDIKLKETEAFSFNELLTGLKYPADDPMRKWKLVNLFDFKFLTPSSIKNLMKIQDDSR
ncbi:19514_t:CDS:2 [Gigaspora margarita]|uniref:19514_t:CDS:1 n=1 Tax=Gigaspora margarita TaxID=4874 RepID=A0ABN7VI74_GIGMA|nr:19514_t:CDS:2 [Gigaspora margarita]